MGWDDALGLVERPAAPTPAGSTAAPERSRAGEDLLGEPRPGRRSAARRSAATPEPAAPPTHAQRRDIQGLRALAVVIVVVNHMFASPRGGFLGVDVFFVISGYLITGLLLREEERSGRLSMLGFYRRRVRRLFPSALTVTVLTVLGAYLLLGYDRFVSVLQDAVFATFFAANWRFVETGTDYFGSQAAVSPLQHYWSLSVEEQYYLVWPVVLVVACLLARRLRPGRTGAAAAGVATAAVVLVAASAYVAARQTVDAPVVAYFSTFTRGWELGIGSLLAVVGPLLFRRLTRLTATLVSWVGLVLVTVSFFTVTASSVPMPGAVLACVGSALVIAGFSRRDGEAVTPLLTNRVAVYVGDISYSVYVVHFPVIVLATAVVGDRSPSVVFKVTVALLALGLSMLLFHLVEDPIRRSGWLTGRRGKPTTDPDATTLPVGPTAAVGLLLCVAAVAAFVVVNPPSPSATRVAAFQAQAAAAAATPTPTGTPTATAPATPVATQLATDLGAALQATTWPQLDPAMDQPRAHDDKTDACVTQVLPASTCTWGDAAAAKTVYLVGDSTAVAYIQGLAAMVGATPGWKLVAQPGDGCPWTNAIPSELNHNWPKTCTARNTATVAEIQQLKPALLVVTHGHTGPDYLAGIDAQLQQVTASVGKVVLLPNGPPGLDPGECFTAVSTPADCVSSPDAGYRALLADSTTLAQRSGGVVVDPTAWFCVQDLCPGFVRTVAIRFDQAHVTDAFSAELGPVLAEAFTTRGLLS